MGCSGLLDADARALIAHRLRTESAEPREMTAAEWARAERIAAQTAAALACDRDRREAAMASGWTHWPARDPAAPRWPSSADNP